MQTVAEKYEVEAMPTFIFFRDGNIVEKFVGAKKDELLQVITKHATAADTATPAAAATATTASVSV